MAHGKALRAFVIKSVLTLVLTALLITVFTGVVAAGDYVNVPAEYYFGRWAQGTLVADSLRYWSDMDTVYSYAGFSFANRHLRFGVDDLGDYLIIDNDEEGDGFSTAKLYFEGRPHANWQIGLGNLQYRERKQAVDDIRRAFRATIHSTWLSRDSLHLNRQQAVYTYRIGAWLTRRIVRLNTDVRFDFAQDDGAYVSFYYQYGPPLFSPHRATTHTWAVTNSAAIGLTDFLNISADLTGTYANRRVNSYRADTGYDPPQLTDSLSRDYTIGGSISATAMPVSGLYGTARFGQVYKAGSRLASAYDLPVRAAPILQWSRNVHSGPDRLSTSVSGQLTWLSLGDFQPDVVLDDYSGFYRHLLFHRQIELGLGCDYTYESATDKTIASTAHAAVGLFDHAQVGIYANYWWRRHRQESYYISNPEPIIDTLQFSKLDCRLEIVYRSFTYRPQHGPGWNRDSRYDVAYGAVLQLGQWTATFSYAPPARVDPGFYGAGPFSIGRLESRRNPTEWTIGGSVGIGFGMVANITERVAKYPQGTHLDFQDYTLTGRVLKQIEVGVQITRYGEWTWPYEDRVTLVEGLMNYLF